jgi:hypothetical protein
MRKKNFFLMKKFSAAQEKISVVQGKVSAVQGKVSAVKEKRKKSAVRVKGRLGPPSPVQTRLIAEAEAEAEAR